MHALTYFSFYKSKSMLLTSKIKPHCSPSLHHPRSIDIENQSIRYNYDLNLSTESTLPRICLSGLYKRDVNF